MTHPMGKKLNSKEKFLISLLYKAGIVDMNKAGHEKLAVKAIYNTTMSRNGVSKVLEEKTNK
jgi:hypothetical protein